MQLFEVRLISPVKTEFENIAAASVADACMGLLEKNLGKALFIAPEHTGNAHGETSYFAVAEVEGHGEFVTRMFYSGIGRRGGVKVQNPLARTSLQAIEAELGLTAGFLAEDGDTDWDGEESVEDASDRKWGKRA